MLLSYRNQSASDPQEPTYHNVPSWIELQPVYSNGEDRGPSIWAGTPGLVQEVVGEEMRKGQYRGPEGSAPSREQTLSGGGGSSKTRGKNLRVLSNFNFSPSKS